MWTNVSCPPLNTAPKHGRLLRRLCTECELHRAMERGILGIKLKDLVLKMNTGDHITELEAGHVMMTVTRIVTKKCLQKRVRFCSEMGLRHRQSHGPWMGKNSEAYKWWWTSCNDWNYIKIIFGHSDKFLDHWNVKMIIESYHETRGIFWLVYVISRTWTNY